MWTPWKKAKRPVTPAPEPEKASELPAQSHDQNEGEEAAASGARGAALGGALAGGAGALVGGVAGLLGGSSRGGKKRSDW